MEHRTGWTEQRAWVGLAALLLPTLVVTMDVSVLFLATPHLAADLQPSSTQLLWITDIYGFLIAGLLVTMGKLGDRIGRRRLLLIGSATFALAVIPAAFATTAEMLIGARALMAIAGATLMPSTLALISTMFTDASRRALAIGIWVTTMSVGISIGPIVGGLLLEAFWWGSVFLMDVPVMVLVLLSVPRLVPEHRAPGPGRLDPVSVVLSLGAILPVVYGLKEVAVHGVRWQVVVAVVSGLAMGVAFVHRQRRLADPLVDVGLFRRRAFSAALALLLLAMIAVNGVEYLFPQQLQLVEGMSPLQAGLWIIPGALAVVIGSLVAPLAARRTSAARVIAVGAVVAAAGFAFMAFVLAADVIGATGPGALVSGLVLAQLGIAPALVLATDLVVGSVPPARSGSASAISETSGELGVALGIAVMGALSASVYRARMSVPAETALAPDVADAARDTLTGAVAAAGVLPAAAGTPLLDAAQRAFTSGFATVSAVGSALALALAALAAGLLRRVDGDRASADTPCEAEPGSRSEEPFACTPGRS